MSFLKKAFGRFANNANLPQSPRGNFKGFIEDVKNENICGENQTVQQFKEELAETYFDKWETALNNLGITGYTKEHVANRYKKLTNSDFKNCHGDDRAREYEQYAEVVFRNYYLDLDKDAGPEFNRCTIAKSNYEVKKDFEVLKSKVHDWIKETLIEQNFPAGTNFIDMKGKDVDLLISLGDLMVGRIPLERFKISDYLDMRYPEEKSAFDIVKEVLNKPETMYKEIITKNTKIDPLKDALATEGAKEALVKKMWEIPGHKGKFFDKLWEEFGELVSPAPIRYAMFRSTTWIPNATKEEVEKESNAYFEKLKRELKEDEDRQDFIRSKYWEIVHRLGLCEELGTDADLNFIYMPVNHIQYSKDVSFEVTGGYTDQQIHTRYEKQGKDKIWFNLDAFFGDGVAFVEYQLTYVDPRVDYPRRYKTFSNIQNIYSKLLEVYPEWPENLVRTLISDFEERYRKYVLENKTVKVNSVKMENKIWVPCKDGEPLVKFKSLEWAIDTFPKVIQDIIFEDFKWDKPTFSVMDLDFIYNHMTTFWDGKENLEKFNLRMNSKYETVRDYLATLEPVDVDEKPVKTHGCGYTMGMGEEGTDKIYIDIMFCEQPGCYPGPAENWKAKDWNNWKKVKELEIPRFLFESLNYYHLDADPNWWFRNSMELEYGRKYRYTNALGTSIFVDTPEMGPKTTDCYQISYRRTAEDDVDFEENKDNALYLKKPDEKIEVSSWDGRFVALNEDGTTTIMIKGTPESFGKKNIFEGTLIECTEYKRWYDDLAGRNHEWAVIGNGKTVAKVSKILESRKIEGVWYSGTKKACYDFVKYSVGF